MNNQEDEKLEEVIEKALECIDNGKTHAEILNLFPAHREALRKILITISLLKKGSEKIVPSKGSFNHIMEKIAGDVTHEVNPRYAYVEEVHGRSSSNNINILTKTYDLMAINWKIWAPLGIGAVVALVIIGSNQFGTGILPGTQTAQQTNLVETPASIPTNVGSVANVDLSELANQANESAALSSEDGSSDAQSISSDGQMINSSIDSVNNPIQ